MVGVMLTMLSVHYNVVNGMSSEEKHLKTAVCLSLGSSGVSKAIPYGAKWEVLLVYSAKEESRAETRRIVECAKLVGFEAVKIVYTDNIVTKEVK